MRSDDDDEVGGYEPKARPSKRARGAAAQPAAAQQRAEDQPKQQPPPPQHDQNHAVGLDGSAQPRLIQRGRPCPAAIRAYEDALKKVRGAGASGALSRPLRPRSVHTLHRRPLCGAASSPMVSYLRRNV